MLISKVVQMAVEQIPRKYALNCIVSNCHLYIVFLENNNTTISSDIMAEVNNHQGNTGELCI